MNWDRIQGNWKQLKGELKTKWGKLAYGKKTRRNKNTDRFIVRKRGSK